MTYRRNHDDDVFSSRWRIRHCADLIELGIPADVARDDRRWNHVLLHAYDVETGWSESWLADEQAQKLRQFLKPVVADVVGIWLFDALARRAGG